MNPIRWILSRSATKRLEVQQGQRCSQCVRKFNQGELRARKVEAGARRFCRQCLAAYCAPCFHRWRQRGAEAMACKCGGTVR